MNKLTTYIILLIFISCNLYAGLLQNIGITTPKFNKLPDNVQNAINEIIIVSNKKTNLTVSPLALKTLSDFIVNKSNHKKAWLPKPKGEAIGAAWINSFNIPFYKVLKLSLNEKIDDAILFYNLLRYSNRIDMSNEAKQFFREAVQPFPPGKIISSSYRSVENTTPNMQSGAYYSYTNTRTVIRANIAGRELFLSLSDMLGNSDTSMRGAQVGHKDDGLFYYSQIPGINLPGVTWAKSQMYSSGTLAVYVQTKENKIAVAMVSWQRAGWKNMNIIKSHHILAVLKDTFKTFNKIYSNPEINLSNICEIVNKVNNMPALEKNKLYSKYCDYVLKWRKTKPKSFNPFKKTILAKLYNDKSLNKMKREYIDTLIMQEYVRQLIKQPTWSAKKETKSIVKNLND